ncbi:MAG TPA: NUDIX domain-containing protein, partial [Longimicrobium sp.]|nr:NUDIX domain-containing protein [Longimicrobium sp.]
GHVLLEHRPDLARWQGGEWLFPGGRIEATDGPAPADAAFFRELREELGCTPGDWQALPLVDTRHGDASFLMQPFAVREWVGEVPAHVLDKPAAALRWVPLAEAAASPVRAVRAMVDSLPEAAALRAAPATGEQRHRDFVKMVAALWASTEQTNAAGAHFEHPRTLLDRLILRARDIDPSWEEWRSANRGEVAQLRAALRGSQPGGER